MCDSHLYEGGGSRHVFVRGEESLGPADGHVRPGAAGVVLKQKHCLEKWTDIKMYMFY